jgi:hypothetical protein
MSLERQYVVVTTTSTHRMRYVVPMDELQALNPEQPVDPKWALDNVTCEEVEEFSQDWMGEQIVDYDVIDQEQMLRLFDRDNPYLSQWTEEQKLNYVRKWQKNKV